MNRCYRLCRMTCTATARECDRLARFPKQERAAYLRTRPLTAEDRANGNLTLREQRISRRVKRIPEDE